MGRAPRSTVNRDRDRAHYRRIRAACALCGQPIDYDLPHTDPRSFTRDHVIPLARGGTDTRGNTQATHRDCNSKKRARLIAPIVRRSRSLD